MELKDMILSTLAELDEQTEAHEQAEKKANTPKEPASEQATPGQMPSEEPVAPSDDTRFLKNVRERILVLFEGFQSPNNQNIEAKVDLTLNFLEYLLASIDERLEKLEQPPRR
jgi:hypothetical protein